MDEEKGGGVTNARGIDVIYTQALLSAGATRKAIFDYYTACRSQETSVHKWHYMADDGTLHV
jgi:hypothetical protein